MGKLAKLCVIVTTDYGEDASSDVLQWKHELMLDRNTTISVFSEDTREGWVFKDIWAPNSESKKSDFIRQIENELIDFIAPMPALGSYESCHIVLNTHGSVRTKDLQDMAIKKIVEVISNAAIPISQISALFCNAMSFKVNEYGNMSSERVINILCDKLKKLNTRIPQEFKIFGYSGIYDPTVLEGEAIVKAILTGNTGKGFESVKFISIKTNAVPSVNNLLDFVEDAVMYIHKNRNSGGMYKPYENFLGNVLSHLYDKLQQNYRDGNFVPTDESKILNDALKEYEPLKSALNLENLQKTYQEWKKTYKVYSEPRLKMFSSYVQTYRDNLHLITFPMSKVPEKVISDASVVRASLDLMTAAASTSVSALSLNTRGLWPNKKCAEQEPRENDENQENVEIRKNRNG